MQLAEGGRGDRCSSSSAFLSRVALDGQVSPWKQAAAAAATSKRASGTEDGQPICIARSGQKDWPGVDLPQARLALPPGRGKCPADIFIPSSSSLKGPDPSIHHQCLSLGLAIHLTSRDRKLLILRTSKRSIHVLQVS